MPRFLSALLVAAVGVGSLNAPTLRADDAQSQPASIEPNLSAPPVPPLLAPAPDQLPRQDTQPVERPLRIQLGEAARAFIAPEVAKPMGALDFNPFRRADSPARQFAAATSDVQLVGHFEPALIPSDAALAASVATMSHPPAPSSDEQLWLDMPFQTEGMFYLDHGVFRSAFQQPLAPLQPLQPVQPPTLEPFEPTAPAGGGIDTLGMVSIAELAAAVGGGPAQSVSQQQAQTIAPTDLGGLLQSASSIQSVNTTRRSPVALDPNIRGYKFGQVFTQATGAYWFPAREDLDTMLSKIDPGLVEDVVVIPGPYGLRYGPGLSFIDIITRETPRYENGPESSWRINGNERTNGGQFYGRATATGGNYDYGYRFSYGHRKGSDYEAGNDLRIPSSYENRDVWAQFGRNTNGPHQRVEATYLRLDQTDTEYAAQFFDIDALVTQGTTLRATDDDPGSPWTKFTVDGWWNRTKFDGSVTPSKRRPDFPVIQRVEFSLDNELGGTNILTGSTIGSNVSSGTRWEVLYGELDDMYLRMGTDFHYLTNRIREDFNILHIEPMIPPINLPVMTNLPKSRLRDNGLYAEYGLPVMDHWDLALGGRADWVETHVDERDVRPNPQFGDQFTTNDAIYAYYFTNNVELTDAWTLRAGAGYSQRPPTLTERYADGVFLGILQSGFTRVIGDSALKPERGYQVDVGLTADYDNVRFVGGWFYGWVVDYSTFQGLTVVEFFDARLVRFFNTKLAVLTGFEVAGEWDWSDWFTPFGKMKYVEGTDREINAPLPSIPPLEATAGFRIHDTTSERVWEVETGVRMVHAQDRLGEIRLLGTPDEIVIEERTPGFTTAYIRAYYNWTEDLTFVVGIDNITNRTYQEHLDLRLLGPTGFPAPPTRVLSPGITPYVAVDWEF